jgi:hypothetical protein
LEEDNLWRTATVVVSIGEDGKLNGLKEMIEYEKTHVLFKIKLLILTIYFNPMLEIHSYHSHITLAFS